ncbi:dCTP deaminase [Roseibium aggregatum]|uniref:dCTP deaminase n=1 Tax=Roseibium aggregatum TaxID=187304 RepID=UPI001E558EC4|nr:dCTP deaminase [Roseibium aggregatum]UES37642.1 dCTP deaminase [Roseibium aggregatum]
MLGINKIQEYLQIEDPESRLIICPNPYKLNSYTPTGASIDFRLGRWFLIMQQSKTHKIDLTIGRDEKDFEYKEGKQYFVPFSEKFVLHPGRFVLAVTFEWLKLPPSLGAYVIGKSSLGRRGLIIETAAGIHPGFSGCLTLELYNCGEIPIVISPGMRICQLFFHEIVGGVEAPNSKFGGRRRPTFGGFEPDDFVKRNHASGKQLSF